MCRGEIITACELHVDSQWLVVDQNKIDETTLISFVIDRLRIFMCILKFQNV